MSVRQYYRPISRIRLNVIHPSPWSSKGTFHNILVSYLCAQSHAQDSVSS
jgi:hypothetical protein